VSSTPANTFPRAGELQLARALLDGGKGMTFSVWRARRGAAAFVVVLLALFSSLPLSLSVRAATNLAAGDVAVIADADGDNVRLRAAAGYDGAVITSFPEGTELDIVRGPVEADDGSLWYRVTDGDVTGYMIADYLAAAGSSGGDTVTTSDLNLRAGPSTADEVVLVMPPGASVSIDGDPENGFYPVTYRGTSGWAYGGYLDLGSGTGSGETTTVLSALNLRAGPSTADDVLLVMDEGAVVELTGEEENGFFGVVFQGIKGWAYGAYLDAGDGGGSAIGEAGVTSALNLRTGPSTADEVLTVMPGGATVEVLGDPENGFYPVRYNGGEGWAFGDYLDFGGAASVSGSAIVWPVSGGEWEISQGYNGSSHYNASSTYQYYYSFDIIRTDGNTAGQPVYSPVDGTIRWTERASGGIAIDMGNGYAVAMFHITVDRGLSWGDHLSQGQTIGYISGPGEDGNMGFDHLHFTLWATTDGGNWSRQAVPFTGQNAIAGVNFPDTGGYSQWQGTIFYP
jgi:uncharacterized protein YraI